MYRLITERDIGVIQLVEYLVMYQVITGSSPVTYTINNFIGKKIVKQILTKKVWWNKKKCSTFALSMIKEQFLITYWRGKILQNVLWHIGNKHYISKADINIGEDRWKTTVSIRHDRWNLSSVNIWKNPSKRTIS